MSSLKKIKEPKKAERFVIAPFFQRTVAAIIDYALFYGFVWLFDLLMGDFIRGWFKLAEDGSVTNKANAVSVVIVALLASLLVYYVPTLFFKHGKTVGKKIFKIKVISKDGKPCSNFKTFYRVVLGFYGIEYVTCIFMSGIPFFMVVSYFFAFINKYHQAFHDLVSGTMVVSDEKQAIILKEKEVIDKSEQTKAVNVRIK
ncbi:MAG: RDD family protein [Bacilli bacterium]|jgi:uncharacterized RDD family membrane protein YckC|nr:RDD family protein [Bacilli bacterium]MDD3422025.1 RDD family protein [Bacilli bacterium]MDD4065655.1 RDD family protein [Bacilli bacterium]